MCIIVFSVYFLINVQEVNRIMLPYILCIIIFLIGLYSVISKKSLIKIVIGLVIMEHSINLFLILIGFRVGGISPILFKGMTKEEILQRAVDPLPQALVVTSIVIGLGTMALAISLCIRLYEKYGTFDITEIRRLKG